MPQINWEWVYKQIEEKRMTKLEGNALISLLKPWEALTLTPAQSKKVIEYFSKLSLNVSLVESLEKDEVWVPARPGAIKVGDTMMVLPDAYEEPNLAAMHNGRRGRVVRISYGNIILAYTDGKEPQLSTAHHSPYKLQKLVN